MSGLKRTLGFPMLTFYGTGMILGAGIYSIIGKAAEKTGDTLWLGFAFAGIAAFLTALSYAELSTMFPKAGAEFIYLREAFKKKKWIGSTVGISMAFSGAATAATVSLAFSGYLGQFMQVQDALVAGLILILFTGISIIGIRASGWVTVISTLIEVGGLIFIIYLGITSEKFGQALDAIPHLGTFSGTAIIIFSFFGFENIVNLAEETKNPEKDLPRAILLSVIISTVLYVLVSLSALTLLTPEKLAESSAPLMSVAKVASEKAGRVLGAIALFSTANTALISLIGASRILYAMGQANAIPQISARVLPKRKTPWIASLIILVASLLLLPLGKLELIAGISSFSTIVAFTSVNIAIIFLRHSQITTQRPFRVPFSVGKIPIPALLGALVSISLLTQFNLQIYLISAGFLFISTMALLWREKWS